MTMIEFETKQHGAIAAALDAVAYVRQENEHYYVAIQGQEERYSWEVDRANYDKIRDAMRGYAVSADSQ